MYTVGSDTDPNSGMDAFWLDQLTTQSGILLDETYLNDMTGKNGSICIPKPYIRCLSLNNCIDSSGLLTHFASELDGYILYSNTNETNGALSLASASEGNVIVASEVCGGSTLLDSLGVGMVGSVVGLNTKTVLRQMGLLNKPKEDSLISTRMVAFAPDDGSKASCISDYALFARMAVVEFSYASDDVVESWEECLAHLNPDTLNAAMGWFTGGDEYG